MKRTQIALCALASVMALACNDSKSHTKPGAAVIPASLSFEKPAPMTALTKDQVREIKTYFAKKPLMALPPGELIFPNKNANQDDLNWKRWELSQQDPNSAALLQNIDQNCQKSRVEFNDNSSFPLDGVTLDNIKAGDHLEPTASAGLKDSAGCPMPFNGGIGASANVLEADSLQRTAKASASLGAKGQILMKSEKYAKLLGARGVVVDSKLSGLASTADLKDNQLLITYDLSGTFMSLKADLPYSMNVQYLIKTKSAQSGEGQYDAVVHSTVQFPDFSVKIDAHKKGDAKTGISELTDIYVNGKYMTEDELKGLFGDENPISNPAASSVVHVLR